MSLNHCKCGSKKVATKSHSGILGSFLSARGECLDCGRKTDDCATVAEAASLWNTENPIERPGPTCCKCGCAEAGTPHPDTTPVWLVHLKDSRVVRVPHCFFVEEDGWVFFGEDESMTVGVQAAFRQDDIDLIAREGVVEIVKPNQP